MSQKTIIIVIIILFIGGITHLIFLKIGAEPNEPILPSGREEEILSPDPTQLKEIELFLNTAVDYHFSFFEDKGRYILSGSRGVKIRTEDNKFRFFRFENGKWSSGGKVDYIPGELAYAKDQIRGGVFFELYDKIRQTHIHWQQYWITNALKILVDNAQAYQLLELLQVERNYHIPLIFPNKNITVNLQRHFLDPVFNQSSNSFIWNSMGYKAVDDKPVITVYEIRLDLNIKKFIINEFLMEYSPHQGFEVGYSKAQELVNNEDARARIQMIVYDFDKYQERDVFLITIFYTNKLGYRMANVVIDRQTGEIISAGTKERPLIR